MATITKKPAVKKKPVAAKKSVKTPIKPKKADVPVKERTIVRPDNEQLATLEKSIFHSFKMHFEKDLTGNSAITYNGEPMKWRGKSETMDLKELFKDILNTYAVL